jgi:hypothetical protein
MSETVIAEVVIRAPDGSSVLDAHTAVTEETIARYRASEAATSQVKARLEALGVDVVAQGPTGLTVSASNEVFALVFGSTEAPSVPDGLEDLVAGIVMPERPELFP